MRCTRGVNFDVGHGAGSFSFDVAEKCTADGFGPGTVSSDVHRYNIRGPVFDLLTTLVQISCISDITLEEVIAFATQRPASTRFRWLTLSGRLRVGADADVSIIRLLDGDFELTDARGATRQGKQLLLPVETIRNGRRYPPHHSAHPHLVGHHHGH